MKSMVLASLALILLALPSLAQKEHLAGEFHGTLAGALEMLLHVTKTADGYQATLDSVTQGALGIPISSVEVNGKDVTFLLKSLNARYEATLSDDGNTLTGTWKQGQNLPLVMKRGEGKSEAPKRPQEPKPPFPYTSEEFTAEHEDDTGKVKLAGTLTLPEGDGPHPAAILITGSGQQDRDETIMGHRPFWVIADHLTRHGIAVLRLDDRGVGGSTGEVLNATTADFASDITAAFDALAKHPAIAKDRIGLIGHSEGGLIAPMVANRREQVAFLVLLAGPGVDGREILRLQTRMVMAVNPSMTPMARDAVNEVNDKTYQAVIDTPTGPELAAKLTSILGAYYDSLSLRERTAIGAKDSWVDAQVRQANSPWFRFFLGYDPKPALAKITCPVLVMNGAKDLQVDAKQNVPVIEKALREGRAKDVSASIFSDLNHLFQNCTTGSLAEYAVIEETFSKDALNVMSDWLVARVKKDRSRD